MRELNGMRIRSEEKCKVKKEDRRIEKEESEVKITFSAYVGFFDSFDVCLVNCT